MAELETEVRMLRLLLDEVKASRDELRADRDDWRNRAERLLTDQRATTPAPPARRRPAPTTAPRATAAEPAPEPTTETTDRMAEIARQLQMRLATRTH